MTEVDAIKTIFPKHTRKFLAGCMGVPIGTAREWLYGRFSNCRRRELARQLLAEMDQQDRERSVVRRLLVKWATE